ncbi:Eco29kI restriction endonuclease [Pseudomonas sp. URMO17WK12:I6]|uniref:GIY-YIG nuclease family protein n=1 Tax=Pseudomonas sp. URMO17WK12:I6 TaxID=1261629 RepID=UPI000DAD07B4|nr:GIY-YIG nuclease family protein [Pseudomonas sp. URMO17WK12:I6]PZW52435.1 Eco29kI restriction endonuclease [Pseudomonas sp. URMO17WK12:I6]
MPNRKYFEDLEFDLPSALLKQLVGLFNDMDHGSLDETTVEAVPEAQGVYQLFLDNVLVYVGKTDAEAGLRLRLRRHAQKIRSRQNLDPKRLTFKAVRVYVFTAMDLEGLLIKHYKKIEGVELSWNHSGFGSNDPGRERDTTRLKPNHFDKLYPINLDIEVTITSPVAEVSVFEILKQMKEQLPYTIRFQNRGGSSRKPHGDLDSTKTSLNKASGPVKNLLREIKGALGPEWQITTLPGYIIIYLENKQYSEGAVIDVSS